MGDRGVRAIEWGAEAKPTPLLSYEQLNPLTCDHMTQITLANSELELERCFSIVQILRPHFTTADQFIQQVQRQQQQSGYQIAYVEERESIQAIAGFRTTECLAWGKFLYIDDLVTAEAERSKGYGDQLLRWLVNYARQQGCDSLQLDSGVQRFAAHRFYFRQRMEITSYHFALKL